MKWLMILSLTLSFGISAAAQVAGLSSEPLGAHPGFEAFKRNVYPLVRQQCIQCHDNQGPGPNHSSSDPWISYQKILAYTNFGNLKYSKFITKGANGHGNSYGGKVTINEDALISALQKWWSEGENTSFLEGKKILKAQNLPKLPDDGGFVDMQWDLGAADPALSGVKLDVDVQRLMKAEGTHSGAYRIKNPRFSNIPQGKYAMVQGIHVVMNGVPDLMANNYSEVKATIGNQEAVSPSQVIVLEKKGESQDQIALALEKIGLTTKAPEMTQNQAGKTEPQTTAASRASTYAALNEAKVGKAARFIKIQAPVEFDMGSPESQQGRSSDEKLHHVRLTQPFEIQATPVTQLQWYLVMKGVKIMENNQERDLSNPSSFRECDKGSVPTAEENLPAICKHHPVESVSWNDIQIFIKKLNEAQSDYTYRLPTESEYEYVAHAGLPPEYAYGFGSDFDGSFAWFYGNSGNRTHAVGLKEPTPSPSNPEDLIYDIHGNVWEWVSDWYDSNYGFTPEQLKTQVVDPKGLTSGSDRVLRGGSWYNLARYLRSAYRNFYSPGFRGSNVGFRLVRTPK